MVHIVHLFIMFLKQPDHIGQNLILDILLFHHFLKQTGLGIF